MAEDMGNNKRNKQKKLKTHQINEIIKKNANDKGCWRETKVHEYKILGRDPYESVKGCVTHCMSILLSD